MRAGESRSVRVSAFAVVIVQAHHGSITVQSELTKVAPLLFDRPETVFNR